MNASTQFLYRGALLAGFVAVLTGCIVIKINVGTPPTPKHEHEHPSGDCCGTQPSPNPNVPHPALASGGIVRIDDPSGNSGSLIIATSLFQGGDNMQCFLTSQGWDRYIIITNYIVGPNTPNVVNCLTNKGDRTTFTARTCDSVNGTNLQTGIVILNLDNPNGDKKCVTNSPACLVSTNLTINTRDIVSNNYYRAGIYYKSSTATGLANVTVKWSYP